MHSPRESISLSVETTFKFGRPATPLRLPPPPLPHLHHTTTPALPSSSSACALPICASGVADSYPHPVQRVIHASELVCEQTTSSALAENQGFGHRGLRWMQSSRTVVKQREREMQRWYDVVFEGETHGLEVI
jgi:hypothetical protein